jgi:hypothetical protein
MAVAMPTIRRALRRPTEDLDGFLVTWDVDSRDTTMCGRVRRFVFGYTTRVNGNAYCHSGFVEREGVHYLGQSVLFVTPDHRRELEKFLHAQGVAHLTSRGSVGDLVCHASHRTSNPIQPTGLRRFHPSYGSEEILGKGSVVPVFRQTSKSPIEIQNGVEIPEERLQMMFEDHGLVFIEEGMVLVARRVRVKVGFIDTLAVDAKGRPVVIEYKAKGLAAAGAFVQALAYTTALREEQDRIGKLVIRKVNLQKAFDELDFNSTRIVLIAPGFDPQVVEASKRLDSSILLIRYAVYGNNRGNATRLTTRVVFDSDKHQRALPTSLHREWSLIQPRGEPTHRRQSEIPNPPSRGRLP